MRVIAPDVGGGFGGKNRLMPEEVAVAALAMKLGHPVRWIEDRREHLLASVHARDHTYDLTISAEADGTLLGIEGDVYVDAGAYALWPTGAFMETSMAARNLPGPYRIKALKVNTWTVATNKAPMGPYRGVARPGACFAIERLVDEVARELGREPFDLRRQNIVTQGRAALHDRRRHDVRHRRLRRLARHGARPDRARRRSARGRQQGETDGRAIGVGFAFYSEQSGHGAVEWTKRRGRLIPGYESCNARMLSDGSRASSRSARSASARATTRRSRRSPRTSSGIDPAAVTVRYGDTATTPMGFGSFGSRSIVFAGGAVARASRHARRQDQADRRASAAGRRRPTVRIENGAVHGPSGLGADRGGGARGQRAPGDAAGRAWTRCSR